MNCYIGFMMLGHDIGDVANWQVSDESGEGLKIYVQCFLA